jgi:NAD(P)-dependent dehydrogenase (short-subunit alcohol dehydrogenase family)
MPLVTNTLITGANKGLSRRRVASSRLGTPSTWARATERGVKRQPSDWAWTRFVRLDVTDDASLTAAAAWLTQQPGGPDALINNAGIAEEEPLEQERVSRLRTATFAVPRRDY